MTSAVLRGWRGVTSLKTPHALHGPQNQSRVWFCLGTVTRKIMCQILAHDFGGSRGGGGGLAGGGARGDRAPLLTIIYIPLKVLSLGLGGCWGVRVNVLSPQRPWPSARACARRTAPALPCVSRHREVPILGGSVRYPRCGGSSRGMSCALVMCCVGHRPRRLAVRDVLFLSLSGVAAAREGEPAPLSSAFSAPWRGCSEEG